MPESNDKNAKVQHSNEDLSETIPEALDPDPTYVGHPLPHDHGGHTQEILRYMPSLEDASACAEIFQLLSDPSRLRIVWLLARKEECGINIAAAVDMTPAAVSHHLKTLRMGGLINGRRNGKEVYYSLVPSDRALFVKEALDKVLDAFNDPDA